MFVELILLSKVLDPFRILRLVVARAPAKLLVPFWISRVEAVRSALKFVVPPWSETVSALTELLNVTVPELRVVPEFTYMFALEAVSAPLNDTVPRVPEEVESPELMLISVVE